jgi:hypothetical protein
MPGAVFTAAAFSADTAAPIKPRSIIPIEVAVTAVPFTPFGYGRQALSLGAGDSMIWSPAGLRGAF